MTTETSVESNPYLRASEMMLRHPTSGGSRALAKAILSLYNSDYCFSIRESLDGYGHCVSLLIVEMVADYARRGETEALRLAGEEACGLYPDLLEIGNAGNLAKAAIHDNG